MKKILLLISVILLTGGCFFEEKNKFEEFEKGLTEAEIKFEKNEKSADMIGALEGYSYLYNETDYIELYLFDPKSEDFKKVNETEEITVEVVDVSLPVIINDELVLYIDNGISNKEEIIEIFKNVK